MEGKPCWDGASSCIQSLGQGARGLGKLPCSYCSRNGIELTEAKGLPRAGVPETPGRGGFVTEDEVKVVFYWLDNLC